MKKDSGFSLIELMIVVAIVAILAAVAYPNYQTYVVRSNRAVGKTELMEVAARQEHYFLNNKTYTGDLEALGYPPGSYYYIDREGVASADGNGAIYQVSITASDALSFTLLLKRHGFQEKDTDCGDLGLNNTGVRTSNNQALCWAK